VNVCGVPATVKAPVESAVYGVTVYEVIGCPAGAEAGVHVTFACPAPAAHVDVHADTFVGALVGPFGVTALDAADDGPVPTAFVACTVNV
jgi:hypothetical protein